MSSLIFALSKPGRCAEAQSPKPINNQYIPEKFLRKKSPALPEVSELDAVRHFTRLSQLNFSIDTNFYPLGSCTMKYNPRGVHKLSMLPDFLARHPLAPDNFSQGFMESIFELQETLKAITGMQEVSLTPMAGAQGLRVRGGQRLFACLPAARPRERGKDLHAAGTRVAVAPSRPLRGIQLGVGPGHAVWPGVQRQNGEHFDELAA